jgi:hypothetical protein
VLEAGVKRFFPWQFGVDYDVVGRGSAQDLWDEQLDVRDLLRCQGQTEWVIVSTGLFMSFLFEPSFGIVELDEDKKGGTVRALGSWDNKVTVTTPEDIGKLTAMIVFEEPRSRNQVVYTAGETVTYARLAKIVDEVVGSGKGVRRQVWTVEALKKDLEEQRGREGETMAKYRVAFAVGRGVSWDVERSWNWQKGVEVTDVESYAERILRGVLGKEHAP